MALGAANVSTRVAQLYRLFPLRRRVSITYQYFDSELMMTLSRYRFFGAVLAISTLPMTAMSVKAQTVQETLTVMSWGITQSALKVVNEDFTRQTGVKVRLIAQTGSAEGL